MKYLTLITLATTMASTAMDHPHNCLSAENPSDHYTKALPDSEAISSEIRYVNEIPKTIEWIHHTVGNLNISNISTVTSEDFQRLSISYPNLRVLGINGNNVAEPDIANFITACKNHFASLVSLNIGYVNSQLAKLFEQHAKNSSWKVDISRNPPRLVKRV